MTVFSGEAFDDSILDTINLLHNHFHFTWFNALAVDLYHPVLTVYIDDISIWQLADNIASV